MQHTYLRYECADSFGLVTSVGAATSTRAPMGDATLQLLTSSLLATTTGSYITAWNIKTGLPVLKLGHADDTTGGIGTGRALNGGHVLCLTVSDQGDHETRIATGWVDGAVRVFDVSREQLVGGPQQAGVAFSLLDINNSQEERPEPLTLKGHTPHPVTAVSFDTTGSLLASGGSNGTVIVWDVIAESGLFRLLGHSGAITQVTFSPRHLVSTSLDGLIKVWDLQAQCCIQTLTQNSKGEIWASTLLTSLSTSKDDGTVRHRFLAGTIDGQVRVWNVESSASSTDDVENNNTTTTNNKDMVCHDMGFLEPPRQHVATSSSKGDTTAIVSKEKVVSIRYAGRFVGVLQANGKTIHIYSLRQLQDALKTKQRRLKRRLEKSKKKQKAHDNDATNNTNNKKKRGILDDDSDDDKEEQDGNEKSQHDQEPSEDDPESLLKASDEFEYIGTVKATHKIKAFVFVPLEKKTKKKGQNNTAQQQQTTVVQVACALSTNTMELYALERQAVPPTQGESSSIAANTRLVVSHKVSNLTPLYGHPTGVRAIALSSNDECAVTVSKNYCKLWNVMTRTCLQSMALEQPLPITSDEKSTPTHNMATNYQGLCAVFLPGNTHVAVGTKEGHILLLDTAASQVVYWEEKAHDDAIWSIDIVFDRTQSVASSDYTSSVRTTIVTGSADKMVKFWTLEKQSFPNKKHNNNDDESDSDDDDELVYAPGAPMLVPTRVLEMTDEVVAVKFSRANAYNNNKDKKRRLVFVSTLDCTIKVFFEDSLKLFLSLYGHKLPALAVDSSDDDMLLVSGSADKTIKLWGLDFGDTHRTLHGHSDSVTDVQFVRGTHNFFSASKDGTVRYWDGDRFELILVLRGHDAEVNCLAVSAKNNGAYLLSGGMDRQVRVWERTKDIVFLEEERERELEKLFDDPSNNRRDEGGTASILARKGRSDDADGNDDDDEMKQDEPQSEAAVKQSILSISAGDRLLEGLELADQELQASRNKPKEKRSANPMLLGMEPAQYILWVLRSIKSSDLEQSLLVLSLAHAERLLYYLVVLLRAGQSSIELCCRVAIFTVKTHQNQLMLNKSTIGPLVRELRRLVHLRLDEVRDTIGYNLAACRMIGRIAQEQKESRMISVGTPGTGTDVWAGLGLGSDVAAALEGSAGKKKKR